MKNAPYSRIGNLLMVAAAWIVPACAYATGGPGCGRDDPFYCPLMMWNFFIGIVFLGIPICAAIFAGLYIWLRRPAWTKLKCVLVGALHGLAVFEIAVVVASLVMPWLESKQLPVPDQAVSFAGTVIVLLVGSVIFLWRGRGGAKP